MAMQAEWLYLKAGASIQSKAPSWYRYIGTLGDGGSSLTALARCSDGPNRGVLFAVKFFRRHVEAGRRKRFLQEAAFLKDCSHPAIMRLFDEGEFNVNRGTRLTFPFVVAEYLPNTLHEVIRNKQTGPLARVSFTIQLLSALSYLASRKPQIVHRDIKPSNIFIKGRSCVLGDFGLIKILDKQPAPEGDAEAVVESSHGMPFYHRTPDLVAYAAGTSELTCKSDVFQAGLVVAELFTGKNPLKPTKNFKAPVELNSLQAVYGDIDDKIKHQIERMLIFDPAQRPSAEALLPAWEKIFQEQMDELRKKNKPVFGTNS